MYKTNIVTLTQAQRHQLKQLIAAGHGPARQLAHARILLKADQGPQGPGLPDAAIVQAVEVSLPTIQRVRQRFVKEGLEAALKRRLPRVPKAHKLDGRQEAQLIALACSEPPAGQIRWTLRLLADKMVELAYVDTVSYGTVRRVLKKTNSSHG
jgi:transposase